MRKGKGIWQNLFEFPLVESEKPVAPEELTGNAVLPGFVSPENIRSFRLVVQNRKHILSHRILYASFAEVFLNKEPEIPEGIITIEEKDIEAYPVHRLMQYYIEQHLGK